MSLKKKIKLYRTFGLLWCHSFAPLWKKKSFVFLYSLPVHISHSDCCDPELVPKTAVQRPVTSPSPLPSGAEADSTCRATKRSFLPLNASFSFNFPPVPLFSPNGRNGHHLYLSGFSNFRVAICNDYLSSYFTITVKQHLFF